MNSFFFSMLFDIIIFPMLSIFFSKLSTTTLSRWSGPFKFKEVRSHETIASWNTNGKDFTVNRQKVNSN